MGIKPTKHWSSVGEKQRRASATGLLSRLCPAQVVDVVKLTGSSKALSILARVAEIYRIEAELGGQNADTRLIVRRRKTPPIMKELKAKLTELSDDVSSKSALGKAISYTLNHWGGLTAFWEDGRVEVDSNVVERSMKSVALTSKSSSFVCSANGGTTFVIIAFLVNTCKLNSVDPEVWLADALERIISGMVRAN